MGRTKQISLAIPDVLYKESEEYSREYGYKSLQEFILDVLRHKIIIEKAERYQRVEVQALESGKRMSKKQAKEFLRRL